MRISGDMTVGEILDRIARGESFPGFELGARVTMQRLQPSSVPMPGALSEDASAIVEAIGGRAYVALRLGMRKQGIKGHWLSVPRTISANHWLRARLGDEIADKLQDAVGGRKLELGKRKLASRNARGDRILQEYRLGQSVDAIAERHGITPRQVRNIRKERAAIWGLAAHEVLTLD